MSKSSRITITTIGNYIKIFIDSILHIQLIDTKILLKSYKQSSNNYWIEFSNPEGNIIMTTSYSNKEIWQDILKVWNENII